VRTVILIAVNNLTAKQNGMDNIKAIYFVWNI